MATGSVITSNFTFKNYGSLRLVLVIRIIKTNLDETQTLDFKITFASWIQLIIIWLFFLILEKLKLWTPSLTNLLWHTESIMFVTLS